MSYNLKSKKKNIIWLIQILRYSLPIIFITFFGQTFFLLISLFDCQDGKSYYESELPCRSGLEFYIFIPFSIIAIIIQVFISFLTVSMYYKPNYINRNDSVLIKRSSVPDIVFLLCKIIILLIFSLDKQEPQCEVIIILLTLITGFNAYFNLFIQDYANKMLDKFNNFASLTLFWSYLALLIQKIFKSFNFNGGLYLFFLGIIIIVLFSFYSKKNYANFLMVNFNNMNSSSNCLNYIKQYLLIIEKKDYSRDSLLLFNSFIEKTEEKCTNKNCVLKKYLESLSKGTSSKFLLLLHAEKLFKMAISKFPNDINLKINYVIFLYTRINKKKEAKNELILIKPKFFAFIDNYNLFVCEKYLEEYFLLINAKNKEKVDTFNMIQALEYRNYFNEFKRLITKSSSLYYDFWSSLYSSHIQGTEDIVKLNDIGNQLNKLIDKIHTIYLKLTEIKSNDCEIIKLYESFIKNILNNQQKYKKYHHLSNNISNSNKAKNKEVDFINFDLGVIHESDENNYLIISADEKNKGTIINISLSVCPIFGYHKNEIIGKNMNILIPELFRKVHDNVFNNLIDKNKTEFYDCLVNKSIYKPDFKEIDVYAKNKSKYLIPLHLKIYLVQTEENELVYIVEIYKNNSYIGELNDNFNDNNSDNICCILVDNNLKIKTFTSNCVDILKLNSNIINSNYDITSFIMQLNEDFQANFTITNKDYTDLEISEIVNEEKTYMKLNENTSNKNIVIDINSTINKSIENKIKHKKKLIKSKFLYPRKITWIIETNENPTNLYPEKLRNKTLSIISPDNYENTKNKYEKNLMMLVKEAYISNKIYGYYFYFKKIINNANLNNKNKPLKVNHKGRIKKNSLFKAINIEEMLHSQKKEKEKEESKNKSLRTSFSHKNSVHIPEHFNDKKKNINVYFDLDNNSNSKKLENDSINDKYIPECSFNFILDINSMSYKASNSINYSFELIDNLKAQAISKISLLQETKKTKKNSSFFESISKNSNSKKKMDSSDNESSSSSNDSYMNDVYSSNTRSDNIRKEESYLTKTYFVNKSNNKNSNNIYDQYYKVNIKNIKSIIYDFNKEKFIENTKEEKKSQMENIFDNCKLNKNIYINEDDDNYPTFNYSQETINKNIKSGKITKRIIHIQNPILTKYEKEKDFEKEIIDSLARRDEQKAIIQFYIAVFVSTSLFLLMNILELFYITSSYSKIKENMKLLINSANLKYYNNYDIYFLREYLLAKTSFYNISKNNIFIFYDAISDNNETVLQIQNYLNESFYETHSLLELIFSSELSFSKNTSYIISKMPYYSETLINKTYIKNMTSNLVVSIVYSYSFLCNILADTDASNIFNPEAFNFIHNAMNNLGKALEIINELFLSELKLRESGILKNEIFILCINLIVYIIIYYINNRSYFRVINKKMSYLTVFYEIKLPLIKSSIRKCEAFINKINREDIKYERIGDINDESTISFSSSNESSTLNLNDRMKNINNYQKDEKNIEGKKVNIDNKYKEYRIILITSSIISFLFLCVVSLLYLLSIGNFNFIGKYIIHLQNYHNNILELYNAYREFLISENSIIHGMKSYDYLIYKEKKIYNSNTEDIKFLSVNKNKFKNSINEIELCSLYLNISFENQEECEYYMGGKNGIISLNFDILINYFIEEIRMKRNYVNKLINEKLIVGNLSDLSNYQYWTEENLGLANNSSLIFRFDLFNNEEIYKKINTMFINIIYQYINKKRNLTLDEIEDKINEGENIYIILISCHCMVLVLIVITFWIPKIKEMNNEIFKTKNLLSIIPIHILASLPNIKKLLNITTKQNN